MNKKQKLIFIISSSVLILFLLWFFLDGVAVTAYKVEPKDAIKGITVSGMVRSKEDILVTTNIISSIEKFYIEEGDYVKKGQIIATLQRSEAEGYLESAEGRLMSAEWELRNLLTEPRQQEVAIAKADIEHKQQQLSVLKYTYKKTLADLDYAKLEEERYKDLEEAGAVTKREWEQKVLTKRELENTLGEIEEHTHEVMAQITQAKENLSLTLNKIKTEQIKSAEGKVESAKGDAKASEGNLEKYIIRAPMSGIVVDRILHTGDIASPNSPVVRLVVPEKRVLGMDVEESQMEFIKLGQEALAVFDAYPDRVFKTSVRYVGKMVDASTGTFVTKLYLPKEPVNFLVGMTVDATIITDKRKNVLVVPTEFIFQKDGKYYVFRKFGFWAKKTYVKTEIFDNGRSIITSGLKKGDVVLKGIKKNKLKNNVHIKIREFLTK